jgi:hypothetical protein
MVIVPQTQTPADLRKRFTAVEGPAVWSKRGCASKGRGLSISMCKR